MELELIWGSGFIMLATQRLATRVASLQRVAVRSMSTGLQASVSASSTMPAWAVMAPQPTTIDIDSPANDAVVGLWDVPEELDIDGVDEADSPIMELIKRQYQPSNKRRRSTHGFLNRLKTKNGRRVIKRRIAKGRRRVGL